MKPWTMPAFCAAVVLTNGVVFGALCAAGGWEATSMLSGTFPDGDPVVNGLLAAATMVSYWSWIGLCPALAIAAVVRVVLMGVPERSA